MIRILSAGAAALVLCATADAQFVRHRAPAQPAGVIRPVSLPITGSLTPPSPIAPIPPTPRAPLSLVPGFNPGFGFGFGGLWPLYYDDPFYQQPLVPAAATAPASNVTNVTNVNYIVPPPPPELRAKLTLNIPPNAKVLLAGKEVDTAALPVVLESPVLREGQRYVFDVKVSWREGDKTEERARTVSVDAGDSKSMTYLSGR
jgi:uncharacterized protein (TIGR03000 family)